MVFIYLQYLMVGIRTKIPFRLVLFSEDFGEPFRIINIKPEKIIPNKIYQVNKLNKLEILAASPFIDEADELIELFEDQELVFCEYEQFYLLKALFKNIGYNFNLNPIILWPAGNKGNKNLDTLKKLISANQHSSSITFAKIFLEQMFAKQIQQKKNLKDYLVEHLQPNREFSKYQKSPGVYFSEMKMMK